MVDYTQKGEQISDKGFFIRNHPHYFHSDIGEKNDKLRALELNFLEGANV